MSDAESKFSDAGTMIPKRGAIKADKMMTICGVLEIWLWTSSSKQQYIGRNTWQLTKDFGVDIGGNCGKVESEDNLPAVPDKKLIY